jgi:hypothetical protein
MDHTLILRSQWVGACLDVQESESGRLVIVSGDGVEDPEEIEAECLDHVQPAPGDRVLLIHPDGCERPVVIGTIAAHAQAVPLALPSGYTLEPEASVLRLRAPDGRIVLEIEASGPVPIIRPADTDLELDLSGRLRVAARSIELRSKLGDVIIGANDDVIVQGERIRLN